MKQEQIKEFAQEVARETAQAVAKEIATNYKEMLTQTETAMYLGVSVSYLYKLTMEGQIPYYKPLGKMNYFKRTELEAWLQRNRVEATSTLNAQALNYCRKGGTK